MSYYDGQPLERKCALALQYSRNYVKAMPIAPASEEHITGLCDLVDELRAALPAWQPISTAPKDVRIICAWFGSKEHTETSSAYFSTEQGCWVNPEDPLDRFGIPDMWMPWPSDPLHPGEAYIDEKFPRPSATSMAGNGEVRS